MYIYIYILSFFYNDICPVCAPVAMSIRRLLFAKCVATNDDFPLSASVLTGIWRLLIVKCVTINDYFPSD